MEAEPIWHLIQWIHYTALGLWVGGIFFIGAVMAPSVHNSMASRGVAGQIVGNGLRRFNTIEIFLCVLLLSTVVLSHPFVYGKNRFELACVFLLILWMGVVTCFCRYYFMPKMQAIRENVPTFDATEESQSSEKKRFQTLHSLYTWGMRLNLILGLGVLYGSIVWMR